MRKLGKALREQGRTLAKYANGYHERSGERAKSRRRLCAVEK